MENKNIEALYRGCGIEIMRYLRCLVGNSDMAEDLLQETFAVGLSHEKDLLRADSARAWLFGIARNLGLNAIRRKRVFSPLITDPLAADVREDERLEQMRKAIDCLPASLREILLLKLQQELSYQEIATVLSIPVGTVRSRLHHAVRLLRERMNPIC